MKRKTSKAKKVWIFKWLLKKNRCLEVHLESGFYGTKDSKKTEFCKVILDMDDGKRFTLGIDIFQKCPKLPTVFYSVFMISFKLSISCADVLNEIMRAMENNDSDCWMSDGWFVQCTGPFLKKDTAIEELSIEFDLARRDIFDFK